MSNVLFYIRSLHLLYMACNVLAQNKLCDPGVPSRILDSIEPEMEAVIFRPECGEGQYLDGDTCRPCEAGTFMTRRMAEVMAHHRCVKCYEPVMYEIVTEACSTTRDTRVMCEDQFYRVQDTGNECRSKCERCDECGVGRNMFKNFPRRECHGYSNTICCAAPDTVVIDDVCVTATTISTTTSTTVTMALKNNTMLYELIDEKDLIVGAFMSCSNMLEIRIGNIHLLFISSIIYSFYMYICRSV